MNIYTSLIRPLLFNLDAEKIHNFSISAGQRLGRIKPLVDLMHSMYTVEDERLKVKVGGVEFLNPVGLAAGYDKSGHAIPFLEGLGFSHIEIGSVSADSSEGNPKPRLFRLPEDRALVVHYGLQNDGAAAIAERLKSLKHRRPLGINIVKTNRGINAPADNEESILEDYSKSAKLLKDTGDYLTFNMSCPNTEMGRDHFSEKLHIIRFLEMLKQIQFSCPVFLKISPIGGIENIEKYLKAADGFDFISGFIFNLAPGKQVPLQTQEQVWKMWPGAVSGKPVEKMQNECIREMYKRMDPSRYKIIGTGGIFSAEDAYAKIKSGASLAQLLTGMVYQGPALIKKINKGLIQLLEKDGFKSIGEAVGIDVK